MMQSTIRVRFIKLAAQQNTKHIPSYRLINIKTQIKAMPETPEGQGCCDAVLNGTYLLSIAKGSMLMSVNS